MGQKSGTFTLAGDNRAADNQNSVTAGVPRPILLPREQLPGRFTPENGESPLGGDAHARGTRALGRRTSLLGRTQYSRTLRF